MPIVEPTLTMEEEKVKRAVKEALDDKRMEDLSTQMTNLSTQMTAGFSAVHTRQDTTNGKVLKNTADIEKIRSKESYEKLTWLLITTLVGVTVYFLTK
jgi:hypothetical protein